MPGVSDNFAVVLEQVKQWDAGLLQRAGTGFRRGLLVIVGIIQRKYLSGPRGPATLQNISGRLRGSIVLKTDVQADRVVGSIGSNLPYAAYHEFGFRGIESVRAHTRVIGQMSSVGNAFDGRREVRARSGELLGFKESRKGAASKQRNGIVLTQFVRAHSRRVDYAGRPFVRPAVRGNFTIILEEVGKELAG